MYKKKIFTLAEANALVPQLLQDVPRLKELQQKLERGFPNVQKAQQNARCDGGSVDGPKYLKLVLQYTELSHDLQSKGCILKGITQGLVDFLSVREGREVFLCWQFPEDGIRYWHDIDAGFAGRNLI